MKPAHRFLLLLASALPASVFVCAPTAQAQDADSEPTAIGRRYDVADHNSARVALQKFERHAQEGDWTLAVEQLQRLLDLPPEDGVVVEVHKSDPVRFLGAAAYARELFAELPAEGLAAWEAIHRDTAEAQLARGIDLRRIEDLRQVARRYPAVDLQRRAHDAVVRLALARGDLSLAAQHLRALLDVVEGDTRASVLARLALVRAQSGDVQGVARVRALVGASGDVPVPGPAGPEPLRRFLDRMDELAGPAATRGTSWNKLGGDAQGRNVSPTPPTPAEPRWNTPLRTFYREGTERERRHYGRGSIHAPDNPLRAVEPVVAYGTVYLNTGLTVRASDLASGEPVWTFESRQRIPRWRDNPAAIQSLTVADDVVYAAVATESRLPEDAEQSFIGNIIIWSLPHRSLVALDARTGETLWQHDRPALDDRPDREAILAESVASPPVVVGDDLFVTTWSYSGSYKLRLVCYDRHTGTTRWRRSLVQGQQEINLFGRPVKELVTPPVAVRDGVVYVVTGLGVLAAVDQGTGEVQWITAYPQSRIPDSSYWWQTRDRRVTWWPSSVLATPEAVVIAPPDGVRLGAYSPVDGRLLWERLQHRGSQEYHWLLGTHEGNVFVAGGSAAAYDLRDGSPAWSDRLSGRLAAPLDADTYANGRGLLTPERLYVPTPEGIAVLDTETGAYQETWPLTDVQGRPDTGTLVSGEGALLVCTTGLIDCYYDYERVRDRLLQRLADEPANARLRLDAGEIFRSAGRIDDAIAALGEGVRLLQTMPPRARDELERSLRRSLFDAHLARADEFLDLARVEDAVADLEAAASATQDPARAAYALFRLARLTGGAASLARCRAALQRIADEFPDVLVTLEDGASVHAGATAGLLLGDLDQRSGRPTDAVARWTDLLEHHADEPVGNVSARDAVALRLEHEAYGPGTEAGELLRRRARDAVEVARRAADADALTRVARLYPVPDVVALASVVAARLRLADGRPREAVGLLSRALRTDLDSASRAETLWLQAQAYEQLEAPSVARSMLERLLRDHADATIEGVGRVQDVATRRLATLADATSPDSPTDLRAPFEPAWELDVQSPEISLLPVDRRLPGELDGDLVITQDDRLGILRSADGTPRWQVPAGFQPRVGGIAGDVIATAGDAVGRRRGVLAAGFAAADGRQVWRVELDGAYHHGLARFGTLYLLTVVDSGRSRRPAFELTALDGESGDVLARRRFEGPLRSSLTLVGDTLVVYSQGRGTRDDPHRTLHFLDAMTFAPRGRVPFDYGIPDELDARADGGAAYTTSGPGVIVALDPSNGTELWTHALATSPPRAVKRLLPVPGGLLVTDNRDSVLMLSESDGAVVWQRDLSGMGEIPYGGEAVGDTLAVIALQQRSDRSFLLVGIDVASGEELWQRRLDGPDLSAVGLSVHRHQVAVHRVEMRRAGGLRTTTEMDYLDRATGETVQTLAPELVSGQYADFRPADDLLLIWTRQGLRAAYRPADAGNGGGR